MNSVQHASNLLNMYWDGQLPIDPILIAKKMGVFVAGEPELDEHGYSGDCYFHGDTPIIRFNPMESPARQRFTIAHELGHIVMGHVKPGESALRDPQYFNYSQGQLPLEREANHFAAQLLMPAAVVMKAASMGLSVDELASDFFVSGQAMYIRTLELGLRLS